MKKAKVKIENGIPIPTKRINEYHEIFKKMKVGASFVLTKKSAELAQAIISNSCKTYNSRYGKKIILTTRAVSKNQIRIWRVR